MIGFYFHGKQLSQQSDIMDKRIYCKTLDKEIKIKEEARPDSTHGWLCSCGKWTNDDKENHDVLRVIKVWKSVAKIRNVPDTYSDEELVSWTKKKLLYDKLNNNNKIGG